MRLEKEGEGGPAKEERERETYTSVRHFCLLVGGRGRKERGLPPEAEVGGKEEGEGEPQPIRKLQFGDVRSRFRQVRGEEGKGGRSINQQSARERKRGDTLLPPPLPLGR